MEIKEIPLIITSYNQLTYLKTLISQFRFYYPDNPIYIVDNNSTYQPLKKYLVDNSEARVNVYNKNDFCQNLKDFVSAYDFEYYLISDPDINLCPDTPPYFLEVFKHIVDSGFHHCGFGLRTHDIPKWNKKQGWIQGDERLLLRNQMTFNWEGEELTAYKAPLDTTFCLFKRDNGGWSAPMIPEHWDSSIRIFEAYHMMWYLHPEHLNEEMQHYFNSCLYKDDTKPSAGRNHFRPLPL